MFTNIHKDYIYSAVPLVVDVKKCSVIDCAATRTITLSYRLPEYRCEDGSVNKCA